MSQSEGESSYYDESDESSVDSDCDSNSSIYQFILEKRSFTSLNVMILMQYAQGHTLREHIDKSGSEGLSRNLIFNLFEQLMTGLKYIHCCGLIHRDIKPENIFYTP